MRIGKNKIDLKNTVSLLSICGDGNENEINNLLKIINYSCNFFNFKNVLLLTPCGKDYTKKTKLNNNVNFINIPKLTKESYNTFCIEELYKYSEGEHILLFQTDGFIINPNCWMDDFLRYDYLGAPWPWNNFCGNGGFSLRSFDFLKASSLIGHDASLEINEDAYLCKVVREEMINNNICFAPLDLCAKFSMENNLPNINKNVDFVSHFGFHGIHQSGFKKDGSYSKRIEKFNEIIENY